MDNGLPIRQPSLADQVYEIIVNGISNGTYPPGSLLPSENQLAERFNVSRPTIRAAFARLVERGLAVFFEGGEDEEEQLLQRLVELLLVDDST